MILQSYKERITQDLKELGLANGERFGIKPKPEDYGKMVTIDTIFDVVENEMPRYFFVSWWGVKSDGNGGVIPTFCPIQQAAWDAAQSKFYEVKSNALKGYRFTD